MNLRFDYVDAGDRVLPPQRSTMNVTFEITQPDWQAEFLAAASEAGMIRLKGHKAVGGLRANLYNAAPNAAIDTLGDYLQHFARRHA